jgi:hypothetical protein
MLTKPRNVLLMFTELEDLRSDPMLPVTRASQLIGLMSLQERKMRLFHSDHSTYHLLPA